MTVVAVEVTDLAAALRIADDATSKWRAKPHHEDINQVARIAAWETYERGHRASGAIYRLARRAAIDELRRLTGRMAARELRRHLSIDHETFVEAPGQYLDPVDQTLPSELFRLTGRQAVIADLFATGHRQGEVAAALGLHTTRVAQLLPALRARIEKSNRP